MKKPLRKIKKYSHSYINFKSNVHLDRRPTIKGTRITVDDVLESVSEGMSVEQVAQQYKIPKQAVMETLKFAYGILKKVSIIASG